MIPCGKWEVPDGASSWGSTQDSPGSTAVDVQFGNIQAQPRAPGAGSGFARGSRAPDLHLDLWKDMDSAHCNTPEHPLLPAGP